MSADRRFNEQEVAYILEQAAAAEPDASEEGVAMSAIAPPSGMTIAQLQEIAAEVGISAEAVSNAARAIERGDLAPTAVRTYAGLPVGVSRTITLDRQITDAEWERLVVALRETFQARGRTGQEGSLRHWSNGNLQALLEPTPTGFRLRLQTVKGDARLMMGMGAGALLMAVGTALPVLLSAATRPAAWVGPGILAVVGAVMAGRTVLSLPSWARTRARQMEQFAETATRILGESPTPSLKP
jgi:hypothetical protein